MPQPSPSRPSPWPSLALLAFGSVFLTLIWVLLSLYSGRQCGWMAALAALDAAAMLRLGGMRAGWRRGALALAATAAVIVAANWGIAALQIGLGMGLGWGDSLSKLGPGLAWTLAGLANGAAELAWIAVALLLAAVSR